MAHSASTTDLSLRGWQTSLGARVLLTYCAALIVGGVLLLAFVAILSAALDGSGGIGVLIPVLPVVGIGLALLVAHVLGLGWGTGVGIVLMPIPVLALGALDPPRDIIVATALTLPGLLAWAVHPRRRRDRH